MPEATSGPTEIPDEDYQASIMREAGRWTDGLRRSPKPIGQVAFCQTGVQVPQPSLVKPASELEMLTTG